MPNKGTGRATPTRAYQQVLGNMFNEQVRSGGTPLVCLRTMKLMGKSQQLI